MEILFLSNRPSKNSQASTVTEYLDSLSKYSINSVYEISMLHHFPSQIDLDRFDVVITHYSLSLGSLINHYLGKDFIKKLKNFNGLKAAFLQDEYRETEVYWKHLNELGIDVLFSCVPEQEIHKVYPQKKVPKLKVVNVLTGYVPETLLSQSVLPISKRPIDIGYRTRKMPYWLGRLGYEKWFICEEFKRLTKSSNLKLDLSTKEGDRLYGDSWTTFVSSCKAVIGVESGASIIDYDGSLEKIVDYYVSKHPHATFEEVFDLFLKPYEGSLHLNQISPRCFEAAALRTPMILFEGNYSGILKPGKHFISLKKDFTNLKDVLLKFKDNSFLQKMADRTYEEIAKNPKYQYKFFIQKIDKILLDEFRKRKFKKVSNPYSKKEFKERLSSSFSYIIRRRFEIFMQRVILGFPLARKLVFYVWHILPIPIQRYLRPYVRIISR